MEDTDNFDSNLNSSQGAPTVAFDTAPLARDARRHNHSVLEDTEPRKSSSNPAALILALFAFLFSAGAFATALQVYYQGSTPITINEQDGNAISFTEGSIAEVAAKVSPAVVSIVTETKTSSSSSSFYDYFYGYGNGSSQTTQAAGTGMIVTSDGYVLTNKHVAEEATKYTIIMDDGTSYTDVELVGTDPLNDVAFLKIKNVSDLPTVSLGNSKTLTVGQQVVAIGNALGQFQNTVTEGVISGTGRSITATSDGYSAYESLTDMIQTDAAINSGNSGGPLINAAGEVIGINTAVSDSGNGLGFAIPISSVKGMLKSIINTGTAARAYIGVSYVTLTPSTAQSYNLDTTSGAYVYNTKGSALIANSPAAKAGIKDGDIITSVNGIKIGSAGTLSSLIGEYAPGDTVQLGILRSGSEMTLNIALEAYPAN